jgi:flagellin
LTNSNGDTIDVTLDKTKIDNATAVPSEEIGTLKAADASASGAKLTAGKVSLQIGAESAQANLLEFDKMDMSETTLKIDSTSVDISDQQKALDSLANIKAAINTVSDYRGTYGAMQNRLEHTINNLSTMQENLQDAESTIRDTDVADEMMKYTKNSILVQSAQAMLAQANQQPQGVLQLLQ